MSLITASNSDQFYRRLLKGLLIFSAIAALCIAGLHIWFVYNAKKVLTQMVASESKGTVQLDLSELRLELYDNKIQLRDAVLISTDSLTQPATYQVKFRKLTLKVASFWPLLFKKHILIDSIKLHDPELTVMQWREDTASAVAREDVSIPQEMGRLYNSMLNALDAFGIHLIIINNAKLNLVNKMKPGTPPVTISNIYFNLSRLANRKGQRDAFIENRQTVELNTSDQNILLPGGRHQLAFKNFKLELFRKRIQLDSCTITARSSDSSASSYRIFFRTLLLTGVDFNAMYRHNLIKADSVYCENPLFNININTLNASKNAEKRERPDANKIIRELTGDLDLAFIGVKDAGIHINIQGNKERSLFNSNKDDFEMRGLRINGDSSQPVVVQRFDMLVRDYHLYNEDSSSAYSFDSIHFVNNKIVLNNFTVLTNPSKLGQRSKKDFKIPHFELTGIDWHALIFDQSFVAQEASLYNPDISLTTAGTSVRKRKTNLFESLHTLDDFITLKKLNIINGNVDMQLGSSTNLNLQQVSLGLRSNELLRSENNPGLRKAVDHLSFSKGVIQLKEARMQVNNARYTGSHLLVADRILINGKDGSINASFKDVAIKNLLLDDPSESVILDGLHWKNAQVVLQGAGKGASGKQPGSLQFKNISGANTAFRFTSEKATVNTFLQNISLGSFSKEGSKAAQLTGLVANGNSLNIKTETLQVSTSEYAILSDGISRILNLKLFQAKEGDSITVLSPKASFAANLNDIVSNDLHLQLVELQNPVVTFTKRSIEKSPTTLGATLRIDRFLTTTPAIKVSLYRSDSSTHVTIPRTEGSQMAASGIAIGAEGIHMDNLVVAAANATFAKTGSEVMGIEKGSLNFNISNIDYAMKDGKPVWNVLINSLALQNPNHFVFGKRKGRLITDQLALGNLNLSSGTISDFEKLLKFNVSAWLQTASGQFIDSTTTLNWYNAAYNSSSKILSMDSFSYHPTQPLDSVMKYTPYQTDYITFRSGAVQLTDFNLEKYKKDSSILANTLYVAEPVITVYRDKAPPFRANKLKPLPTDMIKGISLPIHLQRINLSNGQLSYTEKNAKTRAEGTLILTQLKGSLSNIKNRNIGINDSLQLAITASLMDSAALELRVKESYTDTLSGFLMTLRMKPTSLTFLNPVIAPLSNVILRSGTVDSLHLRVIGNEEVAIGAMNMYYHDLKVRLVKDGNEENSTVLGGVITFLANTFIKNNNNGRTGFVYYERDKERSFFNYLIRSTFSGMAASIGVKKNKKYAKKYSKLIKEKGLPPIDFE